MYQTQQKSPENNRKYWKITVNHQKKYRKHYSKSVTVPKTTEKYQKLPKTQQQLYRKQ